MTSASLATDPSHPSRPTATSSAASRPGADVPPGYLDEATAAAQLGKQVQTLRKWAVQRKGPPRVKVGKRVLYREEALRAWLVAQESDPATVRGA